MEVEWMNHTGFVVSDMERSLEFYQDLLGLKQERNQILEGEFISELVGYPDARLHIVYLGSGDVEFAAFRGVDPVPESRRDAGSNACGRHQVGASHMGFEGFRAILRTIAKSGNTAIEAGDGLDGAEGAAFGSQGHGHP